MIIAEMVRVFENNSIIINGDMNAKSRLWGKFENAQGRVFEKLLEESNYVAVNDGQPTRLDGRSTESAIDLTFVSQNLAAKCNWSMIRNTLGSDHLLTVTTVNEPAYVEPGTMPRFKLDTADWPNFKDDCRRLITHDVITEDTNRLHSSSHGGYHKGCQSEHQTN